MPDFTNVQQGCGLSNCINCQLWFWRSRPDCRVRRFFHHRHGNALHSILCPNYSGLALLTFPLHYSVQLEILHLVPQPGHSSPLTLTLDWNKTTPFRRAASSVVIWYQVTREVALDPQSAGPRPGHEQRPRCVSPRDNLIISTPTFPGGHVA
uniref:Uncharacterized protein n=1 Tax=Molossus molossus TaxID=27622 RepID=A0A7J8HH00_MOLMO|nr:hypothetical protein HJG59_010947 [Molossus molossus]